MRHKMKLISAVLACALLAGALAACSTGGNSPAPATTTVPGSAAAATSAAPGSTAPATTAEATPAAALYPIKTAETLSIWSLQRPHAEYTDVASSPFLTGLAKVTGVNVNWTFPTVAGGGDWMQQFNLVLASGDLPDIFFAAIDGQVLIDDKTIIPLNEVIDKYAPNLKAYIGLHPELEKALKTDAGNYYIFPWLRESDYLRTYTGPVVRKDWLDEQGLPVPATIDDWTKTLTTFKDKYGAMFAAANASNRMWSCAGPWVAWGVIKDYYKDKDGKILYGPAQPGYKEMLAKLVEWNKAGLIDPDFATLDDTAMEAKVLSNKTGFSITAVSQISRWTASIANGGGKGVWVGAPYPVLKAGDTVEFIQQDAMPTNLGASITTSCKNVELAARYLDYCYGEAGRMYCNFGTEGDTYTMVNGKPVYTDKLAKDPAGINQILSKYVGTTGSFFTIQSEGMFRQKNVPAGVNAVDVWTQKNNAKAHLLPQLTPTAAEGTEITPLKNAVKTYTDEMYYKFLSGNESLDNFDKYVETLNSMGLPRIIEVTQQQLDRYNKR